MKTKLGALIVLLTATFASAQTTNLTALLQQGLFEEQANRNLDAAISRATHHVRGGQGLPALPGSWSQCMRKIERKLSMNLGSEDGPLISLRSGRRSAALARQAEATARQAPSLSPRGRGRRQARSSAFPPSSDFGATS